ncbi:MAG: nucleotidyltransferase domain-containing protein [Microlunatus sp.]
MFTEDDRSELLGRLVAQARADPGIGAAALVGSAARRTVDRWSDIDLALEIADGSAVVDVADRWTELIGEFTAVSDTLDVWAGPALYRVHLLPSSLQLDVSFWPTGTLAATGDEPLERLFGESATPTRQDPIDPHAIAGWAWLYALHARSAIARHRNWQGVQMLQGLRDQIISLSCLRHGVLTHQGRGVDQLPPSILAEFAATLPVDATATALATAYTVAVQLLSDEIRHFDPALADRLRDPLAVLQATAISAVSESTAG